MSEVLMGGMIVARMGSTCFGWQRCATAVPRFMQRALSCVCSTGDMLYCGADTGSYIDIKDLSQ
jgi:hypothetical protein